MALSTTAMMMPSAMVSTAWLRCGCGRPSACSMGADDMMKARLIRAVVHLRIRKSQDGSQPGRTRTVPMSKRLVPGAARAFARSSVNSCLEGAYHRRRIAVGKGRALVPIGIGQRHLARGVELCDLVLGQGPADRAEIFAQLRLVARADDQRRDRGALQQPVERDLRDALAGLLRDLVDGIDDAIDVLVRHRRAELRRLGQAAHFGLRLAAADLAGEASPAERRPDHRTKSLVEAERHQLPFVVAADQRIVGLVGDVARKPCLSARASDFIRCQPEKFETPT